MSFSDCVNKIITKANFDPAKAQEIIDQLIYLKEHDFEEGLDDPKEVLRFIEKVKKLTDEQKAVVMNKKIQTIRTKLTAHTDVNKLLKVFDHVNSLKYDKLVTRPAQQAIDSVFYGTQQFIQGTGNYKQSVIDSHAGLHATKAIVAMEPYMHLINDVQFNNQIAKTINFLRQNDLDKVPSSLKDSLPKEAIELSEALITIEREQFNEANIQNVTLIDNADYMAKVTHDRKRMAEVSKEQWVEDFRQTQDLNLIKIEAQKEFFERLKEQIPFSAYEEQSPLVRTQNALKKTLANLKHQLISQDTKVNLLANTEEFGDAASEIQDYIKVFSAKEKKFAKIEDLGAKRKTAKESLRKQYYEEILTFENKEISPTEGLGRLGFEISTLKNGKTKAKLGSLDLTAFNPSDFQSFNGLLDSLKTTKKGAAFLDDLITRKINQDLREGRITTEPLKEGGQPYDNPELTALKNEIDTIDFENKQLADLDYDALLSQTKKERAALIKEAKQFIEESIELNKSKIDSEFEDFKLKEASSKADEKTKKKYTEEYFQKFFDQMYENIVSGVHLRDFNIAPTGTGKVGTSTSAGSVNKQRKSRFKDIDSWIEYNDKYGSGTYLQNFLKTTQSKGKAIGTTLAYGDNPSQYLDELKKAFERKRRDSKKGTDLLWEQVEDKAIEGIELTLGIRQAKGIASPLEQRSVFQEGLGLVDRSLTLITNSKLGGLAVTSIYDLPNIYQGLSMYGAKMSNAFMEHIRFAFGGYGSDTVKRVTESTHTGLAQLTADLTGELQHAYAEVSGGKSSFASKAEAQFFKFTFATKMQDFLDKFGITFLSKFTGSYNGSKFTDLPAEMQGQFLRYNIDETAWSIYSESAKGEGLLLPDQIKTIDLETIKQAYNTESSDVAQKIKSDLEMNLYRFYRSVDKDLVLKPNLGQDRYKHKVNEKGGLLKFTAKHLYALKSYMLGAHNRIYGVNGRLAELARFKGEGEIGYFSRFTKQTLLTALFAYTGTTLVDLISGKAPQNPLNPLVAARLGAKSVGAGIVTDPLFKFIQDPPKDADSLFDPVLASLGGVAGGTIYATANAALAAGSIPFAEDKEKAINKFQQKGFRLMRQLSPSTLYTKYLVDNLLFGHIRELVDPEGAETARQNDRAIRIGTPE